VTDDLVTITLGGFAIELREPLDAPWRSLAANPGNNLTAAHPNSPWVFRGYSPGQHIHAISLRDRLRSRLVSTRAARLGTLHELTKLAPAAIIAEGSGTPPRRSSAMRRHPARNTPSTSPLSSTPARLLCGRSRLTREDQHDKRAPNERANPRLPWLHRGPT
jgi:hypothetical protein